MWNKDIVNCATEEVIRILKDFDIDSMEDEWSSFEHNGSTYDINIWYDDLEGHLVGLLYNTIESPEYGIETNIESEYFLGVFKKV